MNKKILVVLFIASFLSLAEGSRARHSAPVDNASIAREKSGFFVGGKLGFASTDEVLKTKIYEEETNVTPGKVTGLSCGRKPDGSMSCSSTGSGGSSISSGSSSSTTKTSSPTTYHGDSSFSYGGRFGYNYFFTPRNGVRFIGAFQLSTLKLAPDTYGLFRDFTSYPYYTASVGVDYLFDFSKGRSPFGFFVGGGYDYNFGEIFDKFKKQSSANTSVSGAYINFGISQTIARKVRLELGYKILFYNYFNGSYSTDSEQVSGNKYEITHIDGKDKISSGSYYMALDFLF